MDTATPAGDRGPEPPAPPAASGTDPGGRPRTAPMPAPAPHPAGEPADEVDRIMTEWHRERPDLDVEPLAVLSRVTRLARHLDLARRRVFAAHALETWEFDVLTALRRAGAPYRLTPGQLLARTLVSSGTMTNRIDRMVAHGLVVREPDPADGRAVLVRPTDRGLAAVDAALEDLLDRERALLAELPAAGRLALADALRVLLRPFDA